MTGDLFFYVNGKPFRVSHGEAFDTLSSFLRSRLGATGTKIVCEEGDCGACSVLVGRPDGDVLTYRPLDSCILFLHQINGAHVITVEGLKIAGLHPVQSAMIRCHGAQCGFCTPGFVVAMSTMYETGTEVTEKTVRDAVTGNLCRCTGYEPIIKAGLSVDPASVKRLNELYPPQPMAGELRDHARTSLLLESGERKFFAPVSIDEAVRFRQENPTTVVVQGGTDLVVQHNKRGLDPAIRMTLANIPSLAEHRLENGLLAVGATVSLTTLEDFFKNRVPQFHHILKLFGAPQIKHAGTLAGNIANASPIADTVPFLYVMDAQLELSGTAGTRLVPLQSFYLAYKVLDLKPGEIITRIFIPLPEPASSESIDGRDGEVLRLYKVSRRRNLDISTVTAAIRMNVHGGRMSDVRIVFGGVGPMVIRVPRTEASLTGRDFSLEALRDAGEVAREEIRPIDDVRGSAEFRRTLAANLLLKFYYESSGSRTTEGLQAFA
ncbi:MAG: FAD binding domain-containing protein [Acidobacteriota bacterium]